jgi:hypothetical protein
MFTRFATIGAVCALMSVAPYSGAQNVVIERQPEIQIVEPAPKVEVEIKATGHYERQRVLAREGHYETYEVWVPSQRKGMFGLKKIPGHFESRQRWIPDVYEYKDVWVPDR